MENGPGRFACRLSDLLVHHRARMLASAHSFRENGARLLRLLGFAEGAIDYSLCAEVGCFQNCSALLQKSNCERRAFCSSALHSRLGSLRPLGRSKPIPSIARLRIPLPTLRTSIRCNRISQSGPHQRRNKLRRSQVTSCASMPTRKR